MKLVPTSIHRPVRDDVYLTVQLERTFFNDPFQEDDSLTVQFRGQFKTAFLELCNSSIRQYVCIFPVNVKWSILTKE